MDHFYTSPELRYHRNLTASEYSKLCDLVSHPGWQVYMELKLYRQGQAVSSGMSESPIPEMDRAFSRGEYHLVSEDLQFSEFLDGLTPTTDERES